MSRIVYNNSFFIFVEDTLKKTLTFCIVILFTATIGAQVVTEEKKKTVTESGDTVYTESTIISTSEDITPREDMIVINPLKFFVFYNLTYFQLKMFF